MPELFAVGALDRLAGPTEPQISPRATVQPLNTFSIAAVVARKGQGEALKARMAQAYGLALPDGSRRVAGAHLAAVGTAPGAWLITAETSDPLWAQTLAQALQGLASVADQSSGYAAVRLAGPGAGAMLGEGIGLDLHPGVFPVGAAAVTTTAHLGLILWRAEADVYELLSFRSYAESFWHWLMEIGAGHGLQVLASAP